MKTTFSDFIWTMNLHPHRTRMAIINLAGGIAVLGSYAWGLANNPTTRNQLWGGVPEWLQPAYTVSMLSAAVGYLVLTAYLFFRIDPQRCRIGTRDYGWLNTLYVAILLPSALWMPLTFRMIEQPDAILWLAIRLVLGTVGLGSLGMIAALLRLTPRGGPVFHWAAVLGSIAFAVQTALLDALVWPAYFGS